MPNAKNAKGSPRFPVFPKVRGARKVVISSFVIFINMKQARVTNAYAPIVAKQIARSVSLGIFVFIKATKIKQGRAKVIANLVTNSILYSKPNFTHIKPIAVSRNTGADI
jgi:hypothetical protein